VLSPALAFRPARVVERLGPRSTACPLSTRDLLRVTAGLRVPLPLVRAPTAAVARAALVAAKQLRAVVGLALPAGPAPEPWFEAAAAAADELAAGQPFFLAGEVAVAGGGEAELEAAYRAAWRLCDAGLTHLTVDLSAVPAGGRAEALERVAAPAAEKGLGLDCVVQAGAEAEALYRELARRGAAPDLASLRCPAPADAAAARDQVKQLLSLCAALSGTPVLRRGPVTAELLAGLRGSPVAGCEDDGAAAAAGASPGAGAPGLAGAASARAEARAYLEALDFLERLGAAGGAPRVARALARVLAEPGA
jgi:hypothetical protein